MQRSLFETTPPTAVNESAIDHLAGLNAPQRQAVTHAEGPLLVIAGAGSGKTRTLVHRVAHLVRSGVRPESILLLTFTRKSAEEMCERAARLLDRSCRQVTGGTFHAVASSLLRRHGSRLGYSPAFTILDRSDAEGIINLLKSSLNLGGTGKRFPSKRMIINTLSQAVNTSRAYEVLIKERYWHLAEYVDDLQLIREHYEKFKLEHDLMDYDDLLVNFRRVLQEFAEAREEIAGMFSFIMVDEYQDTNRLQAEIVRLLACRHQNVMAVGDDSQSIYSFRGADFRNIMEFPNLFPGTRIVRLEENYRSTQPILTLTNSIIEHAAEKYTKKLYTRRPGGEAPVVQATRNEADQARFVAAGIRERLRQGVAGREIAVLFRSGFHSYKLELELANLQVSFEKRGGQKLTESAHIKDVLSYLRLAVNPRDGLSWNRVLLLIESVGPRTAQTLQAKARVADGSPFEAMRQQAKGRKWQQGLDDLCRLLEHLLVEGQRPSDQFTRVMEYYQPIFERVYHDDYPSRCRDLDQLKGIIAGYDSLAAFVADTSLDPPEATGPGAEPGSHDGVEKVVLSTVHSAKGLEWDTVFVIHLTEGKFPSAMAQGREEIEEERRLFYVASTRAKNRLVLVYPLESIQVGKQAESGGVSRFLSEIPHGLVSSSRPAAVSFPSATPVFSASGTILPPRQPGSAFEEGTKVRHPFFGEGRIAKKLGAKTVLVAFSRHGSKVINLDYAKMEPLP